MISAANSVESWPYIILFNILWMPFLNFLYSNTLHVFNQLLIRRLDWLAIYLLFSCYFEPIVVANMPSRDTLVVGKGSFIEILVWENKAVFVPVKHFFFSLFSVFRNILASFTCIITFNYPAEDAIVFSFHFMQDKPLQLPLPLHHIYLALLSLSS